MIKPDCYKRFSLTHPIAHILMGLFLVEPGCHAAGNLASISPQNGKVVQGAATISSSGTATTINQASQNAAINWDSFNIGVGQSINFIQPNASAIALNRVIGINPSSIYGNLNANGKVFLINPNGILFAPSASANVGGLIASTLNITDANFMAGKYSFSGSGQGAVINQGTLLTADGGYIALLGGQVTNSGTISARLGSIALAAGQAMTLDLGDGLISVKVDAGQVNALVQNGGLIQADGGNVVLTTQAAGNLLYTAVNNTGTIQAQTVENINGTIRLLGDMQSGTVTVGGKLDASAPKSGNGGFIETSAAKVKVAQGAKITTAAPFGNQGMWLIDPNDYNIAASGGDITPSDLQTALASSDITIQTTASTGDIYVNSPVSWSSHQLTLDAYNNIYVKAPITGTGTASLFLKYGQQYELSTSDGFNSTYSVNAPITLPSGNTFKTQAGSSGSPITFNVITSAASLQAITDVTANYALGANIDAASLSTLSPIGNSDTPFTGIFEGLGNKISNLSISSSNTDVGLFGYIGAQGKVQNLGLVAANITSSSSESDSSVGALAGTNNGTIKNSFVVICGSSTCDSTSPSVNSSATNTGGLVGSNSGSISYSFSTLPVTASNSSDPVGGLVGNNSGTISYSFATGTVTGNGVAGGLVGTNSGTISQAYASGAVSGSTSSGDAGGLVGNNSGSISNTYATGTVSGFTVGGLVGYNSGSIQYSYASGSVSASDTGFAGGLVGLNDSSGSINYAYATGNVNVNSSASGSGYAGGLIGQNNGSYTDSSTGEINVFFTQDTATVTVTDPTNSVAGSLVGKDTTITIPGSVSTNSSFADSNSNLSLEIPSKFVQISEKDILIGMPLHFFAGSDSKIYDGTTTASTGTVLTPIGLQAGETASATQRFSSKNVGAISIIADSSSYSITDSTPADVSSHYTVSSSSDSVGGISAAPLNITISKNFDGTPNFNKANSSYSFSGIVNGDSAPSISAGSATVSSAVASDASYTHFESNTLTLSDSNYTLTGGSVSATIKAAPFINMSLAGGGEGAVESGHENNAKYASEETLGIDPTSGRPLPPGEHVVQGLPSTTALKGGVRLPPGLEIRYEQQALR